MTLELVEAWFNKLPDAEKDLPLLMVERVAYTPRQTLEQVRKGTSLGKALQSLVEQGRFGTLATDELNLAKIRLREFLSRQPRDRPIMVELQGISPKTYTPLELIAEIDANTPTGQRWVKAEMEQMQALMRVR